MGENLPTFLSNTDESEDSCLIEQECVNRNEEGAPSEQMEMGESQEPQLDWLKSNLYRYLYRTNYDNTPITQRQESQKRVPAFTFYHKVI